MTVTVAVVGGGYGGITVAKALDDVVDVVLVEPRDEFLHNVGTLRAVVDPTWIDRLFAPYDGLLARGEVRHDRAVAVRPGAVDLGTGRTLAADYIVLATGSTHRYPAKVDTVDSAAARRRLRATHAELARSDRALILGAGPVGLELAGEIKAVWPDRPVTVVDPAPELLSGKFPDEFRASVREQLDELGVELLLGTALRTAPPTEPATHGGFTVTTESDVDITADIWFACYGVTPNSLSAPGFVAVTPELRIPGEETMFAIGDLAATPELKMARVAKNHAEAVAANITALIEGKPLTPYEPMSDAIVLPLGPKAGVTYAPEVGVLGAGPTADIKGASLHVDVYRELLGATGK